MLKLYQIKELARQISLKDTTYDSCTFEAESVYDLLLTAGLYPSEHDQQILKKLNKKVLSKKEFVKLTRLDYRND